MASNTDKTLQRILEELSANRNGLKQLNETVQHEMQAMRKSLEVIPELQEKLKTVESENRTMKAELAQLNLQVNLQDQQMKAKNLVFYGIPGVAGEARSTTEALISKVFSKTGIKQKMIMAHRLGVRENSPVLVELPSRPDAQDAFLKFRKNQDTSLQTLALGEAGKVEVRYHLSVFLSKLLRAASLVKKEAGWAYCRPMTSEQTIEMVRNRDANAERITIHSMEELITLKDQLIAEGAIQPGSPAATLGTKEVNHRKRQRADRNPGPSKRLAKN